MATSAQRDEPIEVVVRAAARALDDVVDVQAATAAAGLATPLRPTAHLVLNRGPFESGGRGAAVYGNYVGLTSSKALWRRTAALHRLSLLSFTHVSNDSFCAAGKISPIASEVGHMLTTVDAIYEEILSL